MPLTAVETAERPRTRRTFLLAFALCAVIGGLGGLMMAEVRSDPEARPRFVPPREQAFDFRLRDEEGKWRTLADARGDVVVLTFLYSGCWDLCPAQAADIVQAVTKVGVEGVTVYGVSVDPVGDTPRRVNDWLEVRGLQDAPVHFLIGSRRELSPVWRTYGIVPVNATDDQAAAAAVATDRFRAQAAAEGVDLASRPYAHPERPAPPEAYQPYPDRDRLEYRGRTRHAQGVLFEHSAYVMLIDKRGVQRLGIPFERLDPDRLAQDLQVLLDEPS
jgi:cytochrome oxidase Cu insertion factor (SCO1/SenC/PrrC family)